VAAGNRFHYLIPPFSCRTARASVAFLKSACYPSDARFLPFSAVFGLKNTPGVSKKPQYSRRQQGGFYENRGSIRFYDVFLWLKHQLRHSQHTVFRSPESRQNAPGSAAPATSRLP
jgi:hypothetical protein